MPSSGTGRKREAALRLGRVSRPESLSELALRELRAAIVDGRLKLGDQISEIRISQLLGISKTPVREALQELRREGLVRIDPQRGTSIFCLEDSEIDQIGDFRVLLETAAARRIFAGDRAPAHRRMSRVVEAMHAALAGGDVDRYRRLDADFHLVLVEGCGNAYVAEAYGLIAAKIGALRTRAHDDADVVDRSLGMHTRLCAYLGSGDEAAFLESLERHIRNAGRDYRAWLSRQAAEAAAADAVSAARGLRAGEPARPARGA